MGFWDDLKRGNPGFAQAEKRVQPIMSFFKSIGGFAGNLFKGTKEVFYETPRAAIFSPLVAEKELREGKITREEYIKKIREADERSRFVETEDRPGRLPTTKLSFDNPAEFARDIFRGGLLSGSEIAPFAVGAGTAKLGLKAAIPKIAKEGTALGTLYAGAQAAEDPEARDPASITKNILMGPVYELGGYGVAKGLGATSKAIKGLDEKGFIRVGSGADDTAKEATKKATNYLRSLDDETAQRLGLARVPENIPDAAANQIRTVARDVDEVLDDIINSRAGMLREANQVQTGLPAVRRAVKEMGGIASSDSAIPLTVRNKNSAFSADDIVDELNERYGFAFQDSESLIKALNEQAVTKPLSRKQAVKQAIDQLSNSTDEEAQMFRDTIQLHNQAVDEILQKQAETASKVSRAATDNRIDVTGQISPITPPTGAQATMKQIREGATGTYEGGVADLTRPALPAGKPPAPLTPAEAVRQFQRTGEAPEFLNRQRASTKPIMLDETLEKTRDYFVRRTPKGTLIPIGGKRGVPLPKSILNERDIQGLNDVNSWLNTMDRNLEAAAGGDTPLYRKLNDYLIDFRGRQVTDMVDHRAALREELENVIKTTGISKPEIRAAVQQFGEGRVSADDLVAKFGKDQADRIVEADGWFRQQFDTLLANANATRQRFGFDEIPYKENYYTHFSDESLWDKVGTVKGGVSAKELTTDVLEGGRKGTAQVRPPSQITRPGKTFNPFELQRKGAEFTDDSVRAFEKYMDRVLPEIYLTEPIQRVRNVEDAIKSSEFGSQKLGHFVDGLRQYGNTLAGKSHEWDASLLRSKGGEKIIRGSLAIQRQFGRNTILGSARSAIVQTAALPQSIASNGTKNTMLGMLEEVGHRMPGSKSVDVEELSPFIRRRYADFESVIKEGLKGKIRAGQELASKPFELVEQFSTKSIWRSSYNNALSKGLKAEDAIKEADRLTERIVAGRQVGERPYLFESKAGGIGTQFQLEANNLMRQMLKDFKGEPKKIAKLAAALWVFNSAIYEPLFGDRPILDPIDAMVQSGQSLAQGNFAGAIGRVPGEFISNIPGGQFAAGVVYPEEGIRVPFGEGRRVASREEVFGDSPAGRFGPTLPLTGAIQNPLYSLLPFGGAQLQRTVEGSRAYGRGYSQTPSGKVRFEIEQTPQNFIRALLSGPYATSSGQEYIRDQVLQEQGASTGGKSTPSRSFWSSGGSGSIWNR